MERREGDVATLCMCFASGLNTVKRMHDSRDGKAPVVAKGATRGPRKAFGRNALNSSDETTVRKRSGGSDQKHEAGRRG